MLLPQIQVGPFYTDGPFFDTGGFFDDTGGSFVDTVKSFDALYIQVGPLMILFFY